VVNLLAYLVLLFLALRGATGDKQWALIAAALFIPTTQALPSPVGFIGAPANAIMVALLIAWLRNRQAVDVGKPPVRGLVFLMMFFIIVGFLHRYYLEVYQEQVYLNDIEIVTRETKEWLMGFFAYLLVYSLVDSRELLIRMWKAALLCAGGEGFVGVYERLQGIGRASAHFEEANRAGGYFAGGAALFLGAALVFRGWRRVIAGSGYVMCVGGLFATLSRGGMLACAISSMVLLGIYYIFIKEGITKIGITLLLVLVVVNASLFLPQRVVDRVLFTVTGAEDEAVTEEGVDQSSLERLTLWKTALDVMKEKPLGLGFYTFSTETGRRLAMSKVAHNVYLQIGAELGVMALLVLVIMVMAISRCCWVAFTSSEGMDERAISLGLLGAWLAMSAAVFFINPFFSFNFSGQFWVLFAARMKVMKLEQSGVETESPWDENGAALAPSGTS
jgi:O-antigen ligase